MRQFIGAGMKRAGGPLFEVTEALGKARERRLFTAVADDDRRQGLLGGAQAGLCVPDVLFDQVDSCAAFSIIGDPERPVHYKFFTPISALFEKLPYAGK